MAIKQQEIVRRRVRLGYFLILSSPQPVQVVQVAQRVMPVWSVQRFKYHHSKNETEPETALAALHHPLSLSSFITIKKDKTTRKTGQMGKI